MIYRKLKEYIRKEGNSTTSIFGTLNTTTCNFHYKDEYNDKKIYTPKGTTSDKYDFLLEYYVESIIPSYTIEEHLVNVFATSCKIIPCLDIYLSKEAEDE